MSNDFFLNKKTRLHSNSIGEKMRDTLFISSENATTSEHSHVKRRWLSLYKTHLFVDHRLQLNARSKTQTHLS